MISTFDPFESEAWSDAPGCEAFELALAMRAQSALPPQAAPVLDAHLAACDACRDHAARMTILDSALTTQHDDDALAAPSWDRVRDRLHADVQRYRRRAPWTIVLAGAGGLGAIALAQALLDPGPMRVVRMLSVLAVYLALGGVVYAIARRRKQRLLEQYDVIATYRGELERRLRISRAGRWMWPVVIACELPSTIRALITTLDGNIHAPVRFATGALLIAVALAAFVVTLLTSRTARRELAGLK